MKRIEKLRIPRPSKMVILLFAAFMAGIIVSAFISGMMFYTAQMRALGGYLAAPPAPAPPPPLEELVKEARKEALTGLEVFGRMVIFTANLGLEVEDVDSAIEEIRRIAEGVGGFVSGVSTSKKDGHRVGYMSIRVPQGDFYVVIWKIEGLGEVESKDIRGEDVTEQYIDLKARLNNLQKQEARLLEILAVAKTVDEILRVESELNRVRREIERLTGQLQYLEKRVELATITISLTEKAPEPWIKIPEIDWGTPIESGLWGLFIIIQGLILVLIVATPFIAVGAPAYLIYRRRKQTKSKVTSG